MSTIEPDKMEVAWDKFIEWVGTPMPDRRNFYRDLFMLAFYLCGIRPIDLLTVKRSQVRNGRLEYYPQKLNGRTRLSIKIEPEAWEIINKYPGKEYLLDVLESRGDYKSFMAHWNKALKAIGEDEYEEKLCRNGKKYQIVTHVGIIPKIKVYYSRILWSTYAYNELDIPIDTISQALGHKNGLRVTNFYVKRSNEKVDVANRMMIDRLKKSLEEFHKM
jgi:integrase